MKRFRFFILFVTFFAQRYLKYIAVIGLVALFLGVLSQRFQNARPKVISQGLVGTYTEKDILNVRFVSRLLSESLIEMDDSGKPFGKLIENWELDNEAKKYEFKLREGILWSDGSHIKASEIILPVLDAEVVTPDDRTIRVELRDSYSLLPSLLSGPVFKKGTLRGTGPYYISDVLYFNSDKVFISKLVLKPIKKELPDLVVRFYPNEKIAKSALRVGEVQSLLGISSIGDLLPQNPIGWRAVVNYSKLVTIFYNTKDPALSDENFRLALSFAAPAIEGEEEAKTSFPKASWVFNPNVKDFLDNAAQAKVFLEKVKKGRDEPIVLTATASLESVGQQVIEKWKELGINASLQVESGVPQNFQALLVAHDLPQDPADQYSLWHSTQTMTNISKYSFVRIDKDLEDARKTLDTEVRKARYLDFQKVLLDHAPAAFLYFPKNNIVYLRKIEPELGKVVTLQLGSF